MSLLDPEVVHRLGWALVHFVWQGAALAAVDSSTMPALKDCFQPSAVGD